MFSPTELPTIRLKLAVSDGTVDAPASASTLMPAPGKDSPPLPLLKILLLTRVPSALTMSPTKAIKATPMLLPSMVLLLTVAVPARRKTPSKLFYTVLPLIVAPVVLPAIPMSLPVTVLPVTLALPKTTIPDAWVELNGSGPPPGPVYWLPVIALLVMVAVAFARMTMPF